ncbi:MAG TPA: serine/threonine-protein kinase [Vicinamibacterales bacterium]|nr:serine/threonine-protein kinase [Vicinamibacterales bacterium]
MPDNVPERIGKYRLLERIGRGGMGDIYTARDERLDRIVAVKTISSRFSTDDDARRRLLQEARAAASLSHPFICTIHEALEVDGVPVIVMEYVPGETVAARVHSGPIPHREVCRLADEIAEALAAAHARGIVHRDITANNVMITADGHAKVMDFGLARMQPIAEMDAATKTSVSASVGLLVGTPAFMAPELLRGERASVRSDLYGFGVVLYLMTTARLPFGEAPTSAQLMADILTRVPVAPRSIVPALPYPLEQIIQRLLDKAPENRFGTAADVRVALADAVAARGTPHSARSIAVLPFTALGQGGSIRISAQRSPTRQSQTSRRYGRCWSGLRPPCCAIGMDTSILCRRDASSQQNSSCRAVSSAAAVASACPCRCTRRRTAVRSGPRKSTRRSMTCSGWRTRSPGRSYARSRCG